METIPAPLLEMAEKLWPIKFFASREAWLAYVHKWLPKITKREESIEEQETDEQWLQ